MALSMSAGCSIVVLDEAVVDHQLGRRDAEVRRAAAPSSPRTAASSFVKRCQRASVNFTSLPARSRDGDVGDPLAREQLLELRVLLEVELLVAELDLVERRSGDVDVAALDQLRHLPVEEREDQRADVRAVDVGVRHHDHAVVAELRDVELVADARCRSR